MWKGEQSVCIYVKGVLCGRENNFFVFMLKVCYVEKENKVFVFMFKVCYVEGRTKYLYSC